MRLKMTQRNLDPEEKAEVEEDEGETKHACGNGRKLETENHEKRRNKNKKRTAKGDRKETGRVEAGEQETITNAANMASADHVVEPTTIKHHN